MVRSDGESKRSDLGFNALVWGEREYEHIPHDGPGNFKASSREALKAQCRKAGVAVNDID